MNTTPSTVTQNVLSAERVGAYEQEGVLGRDLGQVRQHDDPGDRQHPAAEPAGPRSERLGHPGERGAAVRDDLVQLTVGEGGEQHRDETEHHRHGGQRAVLDHDITQRGRQRVGRCHRGEADHQRAVERQCALVEPLVLGQVVCSRYLMASMTHRGSFLCSHGAGRRYDEG